MVTVALAFPSSFKEHYECLRPAQQAMECQELRTEAIACLAGLQAGLDLQDYST